MKNLQNLCFTIIFVGGCCCSALAEEKPEAPGILDPRSSFRLAPIFQNNAVLQRDQPVAVWGRSIPGDRITVEFAGQNKSAVADAEGRWILHLDPMPVEKAPQSLTAKSEQSGKLVQISNVIVGDVWFCSGQSNMLWGLSKSTTGAAEMAQADYPLIRGFTFRANVAKEPSFDIPAATWIVAQSKTETALDSPIRNFSGVAYHFAKKMFEETGIPIGFIQSAHGGTIIEGWLGEEALSSSPHIKKRVFPRLRAGMSRNMKKDSEEQVSAACTDFRA